MPPRRAENRTGKSPDPDRRTAVNRLNTRIFLTCGRFGCGAMSLYCHNQVCKVAALTRLGGTARHQAIVRRKILHKRDSDQGGSMTKERGLCRSTDPGNRYGKRRNGLRFSSFLARSMSPIGDNI
ncbi:MAG TPA: hypothetical protein VE993_11445 [Stellaceae bacterium]|nr:hypothetical protein [Stellaceae bacterium]